MTVAAAENTPEADYLNALGLLRGTDQGYELDKTMTRGEGAVMIVRLLGEEQTAIAENLSHPFTDVPTWADPFVGYMYQKGLTKGQSSTYYGADHLMSEVQYVTFLLRSLGYNDQAGDFYWGDALGMARNIGMIKVSRQLPSGQFLRRDMANYTYLSLNTPMKNGNKLLVTYLEDKGVLPPTAELALEVFAYDTYQMAQRPSTEKRLVKNLEKMIYDLDTEHTFDTRYLGDFDLPALIEEAVTHMEGIPIYSSVLSRYQINRLGDELKVTMVFNNSQEQIIRAKRWARETIGRIIEPAMTDFEKEQVIHDYIVNRVTYDTSTRIQPSAYTIYGALVEGSAVCHGYAESFQYMAFLAGLESEIVLGEAVSNGQVIGHAWNMITLDEETYHIDTTWDDPVMADGSEVVSYSYFNLTDKDLAKDHMWEDQDYTDCNATAYNYYVYKRLVVYDKGQLRDFFQDYFDQGINAFSVKMVGEDITTQEVKAVLSDCYGYGQITYRVDSGSNVITIESIN